MSYDALTPEGQRLVDDIAKSQHDVIWNAAIEAAALAAEKYGLDRVNGMKDYPAAVASACVYHIRELKR